MTFIGSPGAIYVRSPWPLLSSGKCMSSIRLLAHPVSGGESGRRGAAPVPVSPARGKEALRGHPQGEECPQNGHNGIFRYFNFVIFAPCCGVLVAKLVTSINIRLRGSC